MLLILHSFWTLGAVRASVFILIAMVVGLLFEIWGLTSGVVFGGRYIYEQSSLMLFDVPYIVPIYWAVFVYTSYCISNSFLFWMNKNKPTKQYNNFLLIPLLMFFDGIFTVIIDLIMDPLQVKAGAWTWLDGGPYFGIPIGNFIGWFIVTIIITGIYRLLEYYYPKVMYINKSVFLIPVLGYFGLSMSFMIIALNYNFRTLGFLSLILMLPVIIINIVLIYTILCSCMDRFLVFKQKDLFSL